MAPGDNATPMHTLGKAMKRYNAAFTKALRERADADAKAKKAASEGTGIPLEKKSHEEGYVFIGA